MDVVWMTMLYSFGLFLGFVSLSFLPRIPYDEQEGIDLDKTYDRLYVEFSLVEELENAPDSSLSEEELAALRDKVLSYEIPHVHIPLILFYDHEKQSFGYYASSSIIHKYLNVAARKYVLEYGCKQLYKETTPSVKRVEIDVMYGPFVSKPSKQFMEKDINRFHYLGNFHERNPTIKEDPKKVTFSEYLRIQACTPESQSTKTD